LAGLISARIKKIWVDKKNPASPDPAWVIFYLKFASPDLDQNPGSGQAPHQTWPIAGLYGKVGDRLIYEKLVHTKIRF
jgi:hypothetical protein